jgi:hypothetical protein
MRRLDIQISALLPPGQRIEHVVVWRSHEVAARRVCAGALEGARWRGRWDTDGLLADSCVYLDVYARGPCDERYPFATAFVWAADLLGGAPRAAELVNVYTETQDRTPLGRAAFESERADARVAEVRSGVSLRNPFVGGLLKRECERIAAARAMDGPVVPEMLRLFIDRFDNSTQFALPPYMFFRTARPDGRDLGPALEHYLATAVLCRGATAVAGRLDALLDAGRIDDGGVALDAACDALCAVAYSIPYQSDYAPAGGSDALLDVDSYGDPLQTGRGDCEDFALLILRLVLFAQREWRPRTDDGRALQRLLRAYVAAATMRTVNAPSMDGPPELSGHMNVALYDRAWFNQVSDVPVARAWDAEHEFELPTLVLEGTGSMWAPLELETPPEVPRVRQEASEHGLRARMFHSRAPIDRTSDPFNFMRHAGLLWVPDAPPGREQMHLCTVRGGLVLFGAALRDEVERSPQVVIRGIAAPDATVAEILARAETHLAPLVGIGAPSVLDERGAPLLAALRARRGWLAPDGVRGRNVAHFYLSADLATEDAVSLDFLDGRRFTAFAEQLAPGVRRLNILVLK